MRELVMTMIEDEDSTRPNQKCANDYDEMEKYLYLILCFGTFVFNGQQKYGSKMDPVEGGTFIEHSYL